MSLLARLVLSASEVPLVKLATVDWPQRVRLNAARANAFFSVLFLFVFHGIWGTRFLVVAQELRNYAGDEACQGCHVEQVTGYLSTPHHLTSRAPTKESILGSFADGENVLRTTNPALYFRMESKSDGFYEKAVWMPPATDREHTERIDIVIGGKSRANVSLLEERSLVSVVRFVLGRSGHLGE